MSPAHPGRWCRWPDATAPARRARRRAPASARPGRTRGLRPRQRLEPPQPAQQLGRPLPRGPRVRDPALRPADGGRGRRPRATSSTSTCSPAGCSTRSSGRVAGRACHGSRSPASAPRPERRRHCGRRRTRRGRVGAVVSRGGRPDLAGDGARTGDRADAPDRRRSRHRGPGAEPQRRRCDRRALPARRRPWRGHLFEEPGTLAQAARLAADFLEIRISEGEGGYRSATGGGAR